MDKQNFLEGGEYQVSGKTFDPIQTKSVYATDRNFVDNFLQVEK